MSILELWIIAGILCFIIEIFTPVLFFASFAIGCFAAAFVAFFINILWLQISVFAFISLVVILLTRPIVAKRTNHSKETGMSKYKGQKALVVKKISEKEGTGRIKVFGEEWQAKPINAEMEFVEGEFVKIVNNDSLIMYVEKI